MLSEKNRNITQLLAEWQGGDEVALQNLSSAVYDELRRLAQRHMRNERPGHTLQPTALVHEAFIKLVDADIPWQDRAHFFTVAARMMRRILVNHAKARGRQKRGGDLRRTTLDELMGFESDDPQIIELDEALSRLAEQDERKAKIVELHYFGGLKYDELAQAVGVSEATIHRELRMAKAWLNRDLQT